MSPSRIIVREQCECLADIVTLSDDRKVCLTCEEVGEWPETIHYLSEVWFSDGDCDILGKPYFNLACDPIVGEVQIYDAITKKGYAFTSKKEDVTCDMCLQCAADLDSDREPDLVASKDVVVNIPEPILSYVEQLKELGLWGSSRDEVIERLVCKQLSDMVHQDKLKPIKADES